MVLAPGMRGSWRARHAVTDHLVEHLPPRVVALQELGLDVEAPRQVWPTPEPWVRAEQWPIQMVAAQGSVNRGRTDWDQGDPVYLWEHTLRVFFFARGESYEQCADRVELLATAGVETLLALPALGAADDRMSVLPTPMRVALSEVEDDPDLRASIAGAYLEFVVSMAETATTAPVGTAETITVRPAPKE